MTRVIDDLASESGCAGSALTSEKEAKYTWKVIAISELTDNNPAVLSTGPDHDLAL